MLPSDQGPGPRSGGNRARLVSPIASKSLSGPQRRDSGPVAPLAPFGAASAPCCDPRIQQVSLKSQKRSATDTVHARIAARGLSFGEALMVKPSYPLAAMALHCSA
jgi:hypothetical protein